MFVKVFLYHVPHSREAEGLFVKSCYFFLFTYAFERCLIILVQEQSIRL